MAKNKSSRRAILLKYLFFFSRSDFLKIFLEHIKCSRRLRCNKKRYEFSRGRHNSFIRTHQIFLENQKLYKNICKISRRAFSKFRKDIYDFPGGKNIIRTDQISDIVQNFVRTHKIFQEKEIS